MIFLILVLSACNEESAIPPSQVSNWLIPEQKVYAAAEFDQIQAIDTPRFEMASSVNWMYPDDIVLAVKQGDEIKAYPKKILTYHEVVNDEIGDLPLVISYCPFTDTGIAFSRKILGEVLDFGVSGMLYNSNLILFDRATRSLWSQISGQSVYGPYAGTQFRQVKMVELKWSDWLSLYPQSLIIKWDREDIFNYDDYPYKGYDTVDDFFYFPVDSFSRDYPAKAVMGGTIDDGIAYLAQAGINVTSGNGINYQNIDILRFPMTFRTSTSGGRQPTLTSLNIPEGEAVITDDSGNKYSIFGEVISGPDEGDRLRILDNFSGFWFAWSVFYPRNVIVD